MQRSCFFSSKGTGGNGQRYFALDDAENLSPFLPNKQHKGEVVLQQTIKLGSQTGHCGSVAAVATRHAACKQSAGATERALLFKVRKFPVALRSNEASGATFWPQI